MTKRRRILHADKIIQNVVHLFCLLMFLQLKGYYSVVNNPILLYSTASDIRMVNTSRLSKVNTILKDLESGSAVDFLYRKNLICWSDQTAELIECTNYNDMHVGDKSRLVSEGLITPAGIAIDWYTEKIYWTDGETNKIEVISIEQKYRKVLFWFEVDLARAIAVVPKEGLLFWTDWGEMPKIERAGMNGDPATRKVIVKDKISWPNGITIDYENNLIYWVDAQLHFVDSVDFNGENRKSIVKTGLVYPYAITVINEKLFWTDWKTWAIHSWDMSTNGPKVKELIQSKPVPVDIKVYDESRQKMPEGDYPCKNNNGGCSHLCLLSPTEPGYTCACPTGVKLKEGSNTTCFNGPQSMLIIAQRSTISKISLDSPDFTPYALPLKDLKRAQTVDFDPKSEFIYWTDNLAKTISRARLDGSEQSVVIQCNGVPDSIAIDPLARNIYWTDPVTDTINVARLDGTSKKIIIHSDLYDPRAIALYPTAGWMFWSDWNEKRPKIERAALDGSGRTVLVAERLAWPNGIALDISANRLYWGDARTHKIEMCNMDGTERKEIHGSEILHIFGLTLLGEYLYWTDIQKRTLDRINKDTGLERQPVVEQMANMMGVKAFRMGEPLGWNRCADDNGGCSHLCFNRPQDCVCGCPLGLELGKDRKTCIEPEAFLVYSRKNVIGRISIENEDNDAILPIKELKEVSALAVHVGGNKLYWSDTKTKTINRCSIDGADVERLLEGMGLVEGLAIDWSSQNMYWTDTATQRIEVARLDGSSRRALIWQGLKKPKSIALDPKRGHMYWSELGSRSIRRAGMDGSEVGAGAGAGAGALVEGAGRAHALALDGARLYWAALDPPALHAARLDGTARVTLVPHLSMPYALALTTHHLYWGDWNTGIVEAVNKSDGSSRRRVHSSLDYITDLEVFGRGVGGGGGGAGGGPCGAGNAGCEHLCLPMSSGRARCACPAHYKLRADNVSCAEPEEFVLFAQKNAVGRIVTASGECTDAYIPLTGLKNVKNIEYDPVDKQLYWMEEEVGSIRRVPVSSSATSAAAESVVVVGGARGAAHMALDALGRTLYWTCSGADSINATSLLNASSTGVLLRGDNMMPAHLAFHLTKRYLIWNDVGLGAIMRSDVDGRGRVELARAHNATALTVDQGSGTVYWAVNRQIHAVELDGTNKRVVWQGGWALTLAALGGWAYLSGGGGGGGGAVMRLAVGRRDAPAMPVPHLARAVALRAFSALPVGHPCTNGGSCGAGAALCGAGGQCGCGLRCARVPPPCRPHHFRCSPPPAASAPPSPLASPAAADAPDEHLNECIPMHWKCDGQHDCSDGSDEAACGPCAGGVRCTDGTCSAALEACSAGAHCAHPHDDSLLAHAFRCDGRLCLPPALVCDGRAHCADGSDEAPPHCVYSPPHPEAGGGRHSHAMAVCLGVAGALGGVGAGAALLRRVRRERRRRVAGAAPHAPLAPHALPLVPTKGAHHPLRTNTDISSSTESGGRYPRPTLNPPPSPATVSSGAGGGGGGGGRRRAYRHYRAINRPPPPTPASTDACESEPEARAPPPSPAPTHHH